VAYFSLSSKQHLNNFLGNIVKTTLLQQLIQSLRQPVRALASVCNVFTTTHYSPNQPSQPQPGLQHGHPAPSQHRIRGHRPTLASAQ
jgi:hypothetical protein